MPVIQVRDVPEHIYRLLAKQAEAERRSLTQHVIALLARALETEIDPKVRRQALLRSIQSAPLQTGKLRDPAALIREDRRR